MKVFGWAVTILGWYLILGAGYAVVRSLGQDDSIAGTLLDIALIGGIALALGIVLIAWGKRLRTRPSSN